MPPKRCEHLRVHVAKVRRDRHVGRRKRWRPAIGSMSKRRGPTARSGPRRASASAHRPSAEREWRSPRRSASASGRADDAARARGQHEVQRPPRCRSSSLHYAAPPTSAVAHRRVLAPRPIVHAEGPADRARPARRSAPGALAGQVRGQRIAGRPRRRRAGRAARCRPARGASSRPGSAPRSARRSRPSTVLGRERHQECRGAAARGRPALLAGEGANFSRGSASIVAAGNGVRSRIRHTASKSASAATARSALPNGCSKTTTSARSRIAVQSADEKAARS